MTEFVRAERRNRKTGTVVQVLDSHHPDADQPDDGGRWITFCVDHGCNCNHTTLADAISWASEPDWCPDCQAEIASR